MARGLFDRFLTLVAILVIAFLMFPAALLQARIDQVQEGAR